MEDAVAVCSVCSEFKDDNVEYYVLITSHVIVTAPIFALHRVFLIPFRLLCRNRQETISREILPKLQLRKKLTAIIRMPLRLIRILLT